MTQPTGVGFAVRPRGASNRLPREMRTESVIDSGLEYRPGDPARVRVVRREQRVSVTDDGAAIRRAGRPSRWREAADRVGRELVVNVSRDGSIWLPVVRAGPGEPEIIRRIAEASLALYQEVLELEESATVRRWP
jgi:hypothetical protein